MFAQGDSILRFYQSTPFLRENETMKYTMIVGPLFALLLSFTGIAQGEDPPTRKPFDETEFNRFMSDYPTLSQWLANKMPNQGTANNPWVMSGVRYNETFIKQLRSMNWDADRFFYLLDRINMGLLTSQAKENRAAFKQALEQQREEMQSRMTARQQKFEEQMREQIRSSAETAQQQWAAQRARIVANPYIPPMQKQRILAQMDQSEPRTNEVASPPSFEAQQAQMQKQQQKWIDEQKRLIMNNPSIPPQQKKNIIAQMDRSMAVHSAPRPSANLTHEEMQAQRSAQHKQQVETNMQQIRENPSIPPAQKKQMLDSLQATLTPMGTTAEQAQNQTTLIPAQEEDIIKNNRKKLMALFFPEI